MLAATEHLHRRISRLSARIRELEDALAKLQAERSSDPHPLLHSDLLEIDEEVDSPMADAEGAVGQATDVIDALGTLSISDNGISHFFGPTAGSEVRIIFYNYCSENQYMICRVYCSYVPPKRQSLIYRIIQSTTRDPYSPKSPPSPDSTSMQASSAPSSVSAPSGAGTNNGLGFFSQFFPFTPLGRTSDVQMLIESHLPSWERAQEFSSIYLTQASWLFQGVTRTQLMEDMLPVIYRRQTHTRDPIHKPNSNSAAYYIGPHDLALAFIVFAVAALVQKEPSEALGEHFHQIAKAAIGMQPVLEKPSIVTIQVLHLMSVYNAMSGNDLKTDTSMEMTWSLVTLAAHLSQTASTFVGVCSSLIDPDVVFRLLDWTS